MEVQRFDYAIIGAGVYGLSAAYHLAKTGADVALFERYTIGHTNGSSHGPSRISRGAYFFESFSELSQECMRIYWPQMENTLNCKFLYKNDYVFASDVSEKFERAKKVANTFPSTQIEVTPKQIMEKYPNFPFFQGHRMILDKGAAIIGANDYINRLSEFLRNKSNVVIFQNTVVNQIQDNGNHVRVILQSQQIRANKAIISSGRWLGELVPQIKELTIEIKQQLCYVQFHNQLQYQLGKIPSFQVHHKDLMFYGMPDFRGQGFKCGLQLQTMPDRSDSELKTQLIETVKSIFGDKLKKINYHEQCYYTCTKTNQFILDWLKPESENILICSCCSGHGFKFSPLLGKVCSDLLQGNKTLPSFEKFRHTFQIPYHQGVNLE